MTYFGRARTDREERWSGGLALVVGVLGVAVFFVGLHDLVRPSGDGGLIEGVFFVLDGLALLWLGAHQELRPSRVALTPTTLVSRDALGLRWTCPRADIASVNIGRALMPRAMIASYVPYLETAAGTRMWLTPLVEGRATEPVPQHLVATVQALRAELGVGGVDDGIVTPKPKPRSGRPSTHGVDRRFAQPSSSSAIFALGMLALLAVVYGSFVQTEISRGLHIDELRGAAGVRAVTLTVDREAQSCGRNTCDYRATGHYVSPYDGTRVDDVTVIPNRTSAGEQTIRVLVSPAHLREAVPVDYTGRGDIAFGAATGVLLSLLPLTAGLVMIRRSVRRTRVRHMLRLVDAGAEPTGRFRGVLRGTGIYPYIGVSDIELTQDAVIETERRIGGDVHYTVLLAGVTDIEDVENLHLNLGLPEGWESVRFRTPTGQYTVSCDELYLGLVREALARHAAVSKASSAGS